MSTAKARKDWAKMLRDAARGTPTVVTSNGHPVAALVSIEQFELLQELPKRTLWEAVRDARAKIAPEVLGADPFADLRDRSLGRTVAFD